MHLLTVYKWRKKCSSTYLFDYRSNFLQWERSEISLVHKVKETLVQVLKLKARRALVRENFVPSYYVAFVRVQQFQFQQVGHLWIYNCY